MKHEFENITEQKTDQNEKILREIFEPIKIVHEDDPDTLFSTVLIPSTVRAYTVEDGYRFMLSRTFDEGIRMTFPLGIFQFPKDIATYIGGGWAYRNDYWERNIFTTTQGQQFKKVYERFNIIGHVIKLNQMMVNTSHRLRHDTVLFHETARELQAYGKDMSIGKSKPGEEEFLMKWSNNATSAQRQPSLRFEDKSWKKQYAVPKDLPGLFTAGRKSVEEHLGTFLSSLDETYAYMIAHLLSLAEAVDFATFKIDCAVYADQLTGYISEAENARDFNSKDIIRLVWNSVHN